MPMCLVRGNENYTCFQERESVLIFTARANKTPNVPIDNVYVVLSHKEKHDLNNFVSSGDEI